MSCGRVDKRDSQRMNLNLNPRSRKRTSQRCCERLKESVKVYDKADLSKVTLRGMLQKGSVHSLENLDCNGR